MCREAVEQPPLTVHLAGVIPRVHQPIGPQYQQVLSFVPRYLTSLDGSDGYQAQRRRRCFEALRGSRLGDTKGMRMAGIGVGEPSCSWIEHTIEDGEVHFGCGQLRGQTVEQRR